MNVSEAFSPRMLEVDLHRSNVGLETSDTPRSSIEVNKHSGAEHDLVNVGIRGIDGAFLNCTPTTVLSAPRCSEW